MRSLFIILSFSFPSFFFTTNNSERKYFAVTMDTAIKDLLPGNTYSSEDSVEMLYCEFTDSQVDWQEWNNYLENNLVLDSASLDTIKAGTYKVVVQFVLDEQGNVTDVKPVNDPGFGLGERAVKVIANYKGWKHAESNGRPLRSYRKQPITFIVEEANECEMELPAQAIL